MDKKSVRSFITVDPGQPAFSPGRVARACRCPEIQGARETKRAGVLYSTSSPSFERNAVDSDRCAPAAVAGENCWLDRFSGLFSMVDWGFIPLA